VPHTGVTNYKDAAPIPAAAMPSPDADFLTRRLAEEPRLEVHLTLGCAMLPDAHGFNVIGDVRGREKPEEIVVLGAHLDSWDLGQGAVDDAAGVAVVVETAARLAKLKPHPRRTVRVVLYANEENGAKGAKAYFDTHQADLAHHVAALECDSGQDPAFSFHALAGPEGASVMQAMSEALKPLGIETVTGDEFGVDVGAMREAGVPLLNLDQDVSTYFDIHHSPDDTFDKIIPSHVDRLVASYLVVAYLTSESAETLGRIPEAQRARTK
jgi:carboxypeptidase Q